MANSCCLWRPLFCFRHRRFRNAPFPQMQTKDDLTMLLTAQKRSKCSSLTAKIIPIKHGLSNSHIRTIQAPTLLTSYPYSPPPLWTIFLLSRLHWSNIFLLVLFFSASSILWSPSPLYHALYVVIPLPLLTLSSAYIAPFKAKSYDSFTFLFKVTLCPRAFLGSSLCHRRA